MDKRNLPDRYTDLREELKLSQTELATKLDVSKQSISAYENGDRMPNADQLIKYANFFHVSTDYLLGLTDVKSANADLIAACKCTGLTEGAIQNLCLQSVLESSYLSEFLENEAFIPFAVGLFTIKTDSEKYVNRFNEIIQSESNEINYNKLRQEMNQMETVLNARFYLAEKALREMVSSFDQRNKYPENYFSDELLNFFAKESKPKGT